MTRRYQTTWTCPLCPANVTVYAHLEHVPTHWCKARGGRIYDLVIVDDEPPEAA